MHPTNCYKESVSEMPDTNPYESPTLQSYSKDKDSAQQAEASLNLEKKAKRIGNAAETATLIGVMPILGLLLIPYFVAIFLLAFDLGHCNSLSLFAITQIEGPPCVHQI